MNLVMTKKNLMVVFFIGFAFIAGIAYWQFPYFEGEIQQTAVTKNPVEQDVEVFEEKAESNQMQLVSENNSSSIEEKGNYSEQDIRDIEQWHRSGIADSTFKESDYALYDEATLLDMANSGSTMAMKALWFRYLKEDQPEYVQKRNELATKAIIYGDREMFMHMPELVDAQSRVSDQSITPEERHLARIETLAYSEFMGLRGALDAKYNQQTAFFRVYATPDSPIHLTEADKNTIRERAQEIYNSYEKKRIELGIGPFDNSVPEGIKKLFENQKKIYMDNVGPNAI